MSVQPTLQHQPQESLGSVTTHLRQRMSRVVHRQRGGEGAYIDKQLQGTAYFARPFASRESGSNENLNGLLRQYVPKKRAMSTVTDEEIRMIQNRLNNRPRKRLGFKTPLEVFHQSLKRVALQN